MPVDVEIGRRAEFCSESWHQREAASIESTRPKDESIPTRRKRVSKRRAVISRWIAQPDCTRSNNRLIVEFLGSRAYRLSDGAWLSSVRVALDQCPRTQGNGQAQAPTSPLNHPNSRERTPSKIHRARLRRRCTSLGVSLSHSRRNLEGHQRS